MTSLANAQPPAALTVLPPPAPGLTLPITLSPGLKAGTTRPGTRITGTITQRVIMDRKTYIDRNAHLYGTVVASTGTTHNNTEPATLVLRFDTLRYNHQQTSITVNALAIANFTDVDDTLVPANGSTDRGNPNPASWTTRQIGGDEVVRSGWVGPVVDSTMHTVGTADFYGVYANSPTGSSADAVPLAVGPFSTTARGTYGLNDGTQLHSERGTITLTAPGKLVLRRNDAILLQVIPNP